MAKARRFSATVSKATNGRVYVPMPFDPDDVWGKKPRHPVSGTIDGKRVRAVIEMIDGGPAFSIGPAWRRDCGVDPGDEVRVELAPEGPQRDDLAPDVAAALEANPAAGAFFDALAQFYRKGYLRYIDATKRKPELRAERIAEVVSLLEKGIKERQ